MPAAFEHGPALAGPENRQRPLGVLHEGSAKVKERPYKPWPRTTRSGVTPDRKIDLGDIRMWGDIGTDKLGSCIPNTM